MVEAPLEATCCSFLLFVRKGERSDRLERGRERCSRLDSTFFQVRLPRVPTEVGPLGLTSTSDDPLVPLGFGGRRNDSLTHRRRYTSAGYSTVTTASACYTSWVKELCAVALVVARSTHQHLHGWHACGSNHFASADDLAAEDATEDGRCARRPTSIRSVEANDYPKSHDRKILDSLKFQRL